jgi:hypothetical protein
VGHQPHEGRPAKAGEGRHRRHRQQAGLAEDRSACQDLGRAEIATVGEGSLVVRRPSRVRLCTSLERVEDDQLGDRLLEPLERQLAAAQDLAPQPALGPAERQARVDPRHRRQANSSHRAVAQR